MKLCSPPEFFHKNMSHEQSLFTWSTFRDSSMSAKFKHFWKAHEIVKSGRIFSQHHASRTITFHVFHITWFYHGYKVAIFLKNLWKCVVRLNLFTETCLTNNYLSRDPHFVILAWVQSWNIFEKLMKLWSPCLTNNHFSRDPYFVILAWAQSWNTFEKLMKLWSPPEFFHKNMSHEQR